MNLKVAVEVETGEPMRQANGTEASCRYAALKLNGVTIFRDLVFDVDKDGNRSDFQARHNLLHVFGEKMRRLLEDE